MQSQIKVSRAKENRCTKCNHIRKYIVQSQTGTQSAITNRSTKCNHSQEFQTEVPTAITVRSSQCNYKKGKPSGFAHRATGSRALKDKMYRNGCKFGLYSDQLVSLTMTNKTDQENISKIALQICLSKKSYPFHI